MRQQTRSSKEPAEKVVQDIRRATRKHYSAEEKIRIVLEGLRGEDSIAELCRREGIAQTCTIAGRRTSWRLARSAWQAIRPGPPPRTARVYDDAGSAYVLRYRHRPCCLLWDGKHQHPELVLCRSIHRLRPPL